MHAGSAVKRPARDEIGDLVDEPPVRPLRPHGTGCGSRPQRLWLSGMATFVNLERR